MLARSLAGIAVLTVSGCSSSSADPSRSGSTLETTWGDPVGDGQLRVGAGEAMVDRVELGERAPLGSSLGLLGHLTDAHVMDASSPARVTFLDRLGPPFQSTFRPQEALTVQVLAGMVASMRALAPDVVIQGGDLIDNDQANELAVALDVLGGGRVAGFAYDGVQLENNPDPFYYRPEVDAPRHPGLLRDAGMAFASVGLRGGVAHVVGDHDVLVAGELVPSTVTGALAVGDRALWELPPGLSLPEGVSLATGGSPDGPLFDPGLVSQFVAAALNGPTVRVRADAGRRELAFSEVVTRLRSEGEGAGDQLDYVRDVGERLRLVVVDLGSRIGGSGGRVVPGQAGFVSDAIAGAGDRWVVFVSHQTLRQTAGGSDLEAVLDASPSVIATLAGHTHHNRIRPRGTPAGGRWEIETASLIDWPQQSRALRVRETAGGGVAIETWMLDHVGVELPAVVGRVARVSRELAYLDAQGGRPGRFAGARGDRNAVLYLRRGA